MLVAVPREIQHAGNKHAPHRMYHTRRQRRRERFNESVRKDSPWIIFKTVLHPLTMMYVPVDDQHPGYVFRNKSMRVRTNTVHLSRINKTSLKLPFKSIFLLGISRCYGHIVEHTEPTGSTAHTVVSWWSVSSDRGDMHDRISCSNGYINTFSQEGAKDNL